MTVIQRRLILGLVALFVPSLFALLIWNWQVEVVADESEPGAPKLTVLIVFDQFRGDYLERWDELYGDGGFKRLEADGAWFKNCHYPYAYTLTAPGHTSLSTGCSPNTHGIIANDWYDRAHAETVSSTKPTPNNLRQGPGPHRRRVETVGDVLLEVLKGRARVVSLAIKERSAILLAAAKANACYWFDSPTGDFITSPFYRDQPHSWVKKFNAERRPDAWLGKSWERFRPKLDYAKYSGPDDFPTEGVGYNQGQTFPHPFQLAKEKGKEKEYFYDAVTNSPAGSELLLELAKIAITEEKLGQRDVADLLCLGFSSNDLIGHCWGPDSQEVLDITLRTDALVKKLMEFLDAKVGKGKYVLVLSADHGICPLPEMAAKKGKDAGRVAPELLTSKAEAFLNEKFLKGEKTSWFEMPKKQNAWIYLNQPAIKEIGVPAADVEKALAGWLTKQPGVQAAFTRTELLAKGPLSDPLVESVRKSFYPDESGDVMVVLKPYHIFSTPLTSPKNNSYRTTHGSPHPYDTHVPLVVMGPGIQPGVRNERVTPQATASILARALGVRAPKAAEAPVPAGLFK